MPDDYDPEFPVGFFVFERQEDPVKTKAQLRIAELQEQYDQETDYWKRLDLKNQIGALRALLLFRR